MTINTQSREKDFVAQGPGSTVGINFPFAKASDIIVVPIDADGIEGDPLTLNSHYSIGGDGRAMTGVLTEINLTAGANYRARRKTGLKQSYDPKMGVAGNASGMSNQLDDVTMAQIDDRADLDDARNRSLMVPPGDTPPGLEVSDLLDGDILTYTGGKLRRLEREVFAGKFYAGGVGGVLTPASGTGADGALRTDMASAAPGLGAALSAFKRAGTGAITRNADMLLGETPYTPYDFGAVGDGVEDDTTALNNMHAAAAAAGARIEYPKGTFRVTDNIISRNGIPRITGKGGVIKFDHSSGTKSFILATTATTQHVKNCVVEGLRIDLNGKQSFGIYGQNIKDCAIRNNHIYGGTVAATASVYGIFVKSFWTGSHPATGNLIEDNVVEGERNVFSQHYGQQGIVISGDWETPYAGHTDAVAEWKANFAMSEPSYYFENNIVRGNVVRGFRYGIALYGVRDTIIEGNHIVDNVRSIALEISAKNNSIQRNVLKDWLAVAIVIGYGSSGNLFAGNKITSGVAISDTEGAMTAYVGSQNNRLDGNEVTITSADGPAYMMYAGIHASGNSFTNNKCAGPVTKAYAAVESSWDNTVTNPAHRAYSGGSGLNGFANAATSDVQFRGNEIAGTVSKPAFFLAQITDTGSRVLSAVNVSHNRVRGTVSRFLELVEETSSASGNHVLKDNEQAGSTTSAFLVPRGLAHFTIFDDPKLTYSATYDPPSISAGASATTTVSVAGAAVGDFVTATFSNDLQGIVLSGYVNATSQVTVVFLNPTASAVDLGSGTLRVRVRKQ